MSWRMILVLWLVGASILFGQAGENRPVDIMLVLDNSGSMKRNDPKSLMRVAVAEFAGSLKGDARLGIVVFDQDARIVLDLTSGNSGGFKQQVTGGLERVDHNGRLTDIPAGVERAIYELRERGRPNAERAVVFFTDGIIDTGNAARDLERARWLRESLAPEARRLSIRIFGIAFTQGADFQLIQSVAQTTAGTYYRVLSAPDISSAFRQIRGQLAEHPSPTSQALPVSDQSWLGVAIGVGLVALAAFAAVAWRGLRQSKPPIAARLRDLGQHTGADSHVLRKRVIRVGRSPKSNDIVLPSDTVSSRHAAIEFRDGLFYVRDFRSANGTFINGKRFSDREAIREAVLKHGDKLRLDTFEFEFIEDARAEEARSQKAGGEQVSGGKTRLRQDEPAAVPRPEGVPNAEANVAKPVEGTAERVTALKPEMCPNHPSFKATELCPVCKSAKCRLCLRDKDGRTVCADCAKSSLG
jgi:Mg-chelatase subunit ChlD